MTSLGYDMNKQFNRLKMLHCCRCSHDVGGESSSGKARMIRRV